MNTLSKLDSYFASLGQPQGLVPAPQASSPSYAAPLAPVPAAADVSYTSAVNGNSNAPEGSAVSSAVASRHFSNLPPRRRRRRRATGSSIKVPSPTTPLLVRIALALWSILLSFWRSLVGDTRAVRERRRTGRSKLPSTVAGLPAPSNCAPQSGITGLPIPSIAVTDVISATSDEGSASEPDPSDREWIDPVTRAPVDEDSGAEPEIRARTGSDTTFSFRLRSAQTKETVSISGSVDSEPEAGSSSVVTQPSSFAQLARIATPPSILQPRRRLLPNPMATSLLDPSVPAVPHRTLTPSILPSPRPHQTPFHLQKTLILDLDETLIHSTSRPMGAAHSGGGMLGLHSGLFGGGRRRRGEGHTVEVVLNGRSSLYHVYKRPYVDFFLKKVASWYTLVIFTASMPEYADPVIDWLDNGRGLFAKRLYRESCYLQPSGSYIKDLADVEPDLSKVCFMDNSPISYSWNKANALPIEGWTSDPNDEALLQSIPVLDSLRFVTDVRHILGIRGFM